MLSQRRLRASPLPARNAIRDEDHRPLLVYIGPCKIMSLHERNTKRAEKPGRDESGLRAFGRFSVAKDLAIRNQQVRGAAASHWKVTDIRGRCDAGYGGEPVQDFLLPPRCKFRSRHGCLRDLDLKRLKLARV